MPWQSYRVTRLLWDTASKHTFLVCMGSPTRISSLQPNVNTCREGADFNTHHTFKPPPALSEVSILFDPSKCFNVESSFFGFRVRGKCKTANVQLWNNWLMGKPLTSVWAGSCVTLLSDETYSAQHSSHKAWRRCCTKDSHVGLLRARGDILLDFTNFTNVTNDPHLSMTPGHLAPSFHAALQADGAPGHKVFDLHAHPAPHVPYLQNTHITKKDMESQKHGVFDSWSACHIRYCIIHDWMKSLQELQIWNCVYSVKSTWEPLWTG